MTGLIAQHPRLGGVAWDYVQYPAGLARLGHDVYYVEDSGEWPYRFDGDETPESWVARDPAENVEHLASVMRRFGLEDRWAYRFPIDGEWFGLSDAKRREVLATADVLLNVSGTLEHPEAYREIPCLAYLDSDPIYTQARLLYPEGHEPFGRRVATHDVFFSFGELVQGSRFSTGHTWIPTRQPIVLSEWRRAPSTNEAFTTVMSWTSYEPLRAGAEILGQKDVEFRRFLDLARRIAPTPIEVALGPTQHVDWQTGDEPFPAEVAAEVAALGDATPAELLRANGWRVADATAVGGTADDYRRYVETSKGEWSVAKSGYVTGRSGWFSCRSACYLASSRPVVVQDTGFSEVLPVGEGLFAFTTIDEAVEAVREIEADYPRHSRAARELAEEYFDSDRVLAELVEAVTGIRA